MKYKYLYKELLESRSPKQLKKALEIQTRVARERMQEERMMTILQKKIVKKVDFILKTSLS